MHQVACQREVPGGSSKVLQTLQHVAVGLKERPRRLGHGEHVTGGRGDDVFQAILERHLRVCFIGRLMIRARAVSYYAVVF